MKKIKLIILIIGLISYSNLFAINIILEKQIDYQVEYSVQHNDINLVGIYEKDFPEEGRYLLSSDSNLVVNIKKKKFIAITLAVTLGVFGVHRLYLGTSTKVPIIYTLTLGGGFGVLVISDIIAIIATKNLDKYSPNSNVFMWAE